MPLLTYTPEGADPKVFDFDFGKMLSPERILIEKMTDRGWTGVQQGFFNDSGVVMHAILFVLLKRTNPTLKPSEVVFASDEITTDINENEAREIVATLHGQESLTDEDETLLTELEKDYPHLFVEDDSDPKGAPSTSESESAT